MKFEAKDYLMKENTPKSADSMTASMTAASDKKAPKHAIVIMPDSDVKAFLVNFLAGGISGAVSETLASVT